MENIQPIIQMAIKKQKLIMWMESSMDYIKNGMMMARSWKKQIMLMD